MKPAARLAVLIDADNTPSRYATGILAAVAAHGVPAIKHAYADWSRRPAWKEEARRHGIERIEQPAYVRGKNATDIALAIGAMDILHSGDVDAFAIVSSDSDFTPLVKRLRTARKRVYGIGRCITPPSFASACDEFILLDPEVRLQEQLPAAISKTALPSGWSRLADVGQLFDSREYGRRLEKLVRDLPYLEVKKVAGVPHVRLKPSSS